MPRKHRRTTRWSQRVTEQSDALTLEQRVFSKLPASRRAVLQRAKVELRKLYGRAA